MSSCFIALIAEDDTDCEAVQKIIHRVLGKETKTKKWASKGCSTLKKKLAPKLQAMSEEGCNVFVIIHDLDRDPQNNSLNDEAKLRKTLDAAVSEIQSNNKHICIPVEELEAWFWSDPEVVKYIGQGNGKAHLNPHMIAKPKEELIKLSRDERRRPRYSTNMNVKLAEMLNLEHCSDRCPSFKYLLKFLKSLQ